jgi:hypothetical protein
MLVEVNQFELGSVTRDCILGIMIALQRPHYLAQDLAACKAFRILDANDIHIGRVPDPFAAARLRGHSRKYL